MASAWTFTNKGTIIIGIDDQGFFGAAGADLTGLSYMDVITLDPSLYVNQYSDSISHNGFEVSSVRLPSHSPSMA